MILDLLSRIQRSLSLAGNLTILSLILTSCSTDDTAALDDSTIPIQRISSSEVQTGPHKITVGDQIEVFVVEDPSFNGTYPVRTSGDVILPKLGRVQLAGLGLTQAEALLKEKLEANQLRQATVIVDPGARDLSKMNAVVGITVRMSGNLNKTGRVTIPQIGSIPVTAYQAVCDVGGFAPYAHKRKSYIIRNLEGGQTARIPVDFEAISEGKKKDIMLADGDAIVVPQKLLGF